METKSGYFDGSIGFGPYITKRMFYQNGFNIPIAVNYTFGLKRNGHFELGLGVGINRAIDSAYDIDFSRLLLSFRFGYKYQAPSGGLFFRAGYTPIGPIYYFSGSKSKGLLDSFELVLNIISLGIGVNF